MKIHPVPGPINKKNAVESFLDYTVEKNTPAVRLIGTEGSAIDFRLVESAGSIILQKNTGSKASPSWSALLTFSNATGLWTFNSLPSFSDLTNVPHNHVNAAGGSVIGRGANGTVATQTVTAPENTTAYGTDFAASHVAIGATPVLVIMTCQDMSIAAAATNGTLDIGLARDSTVLSTIVSNASMAYSGGESFGPITFVHFDTAPSAATYSYRPFVATTGDITQDQVQVTFTRAKVTTFGI